MNASMVVRKGFHEWARSGVTLTPGYTIVMPVPGDLPIFLKIALEVCAAQDDEHQVETLVVPDQLPPGFPELLAEWTRNHSMPSVRLVTLKPIDQLVLRSSNHPHINHWLQIVRGMEAVRTTHALLHDADLFIIKPQFLRIHYQACVERGLACLGVSEAWDSWYHEQGITHLVSTWEAVFNINWFRSFTPWDHRGHDGMVAGQRHTFDTTFWPQCQTRPDQIGHHNQDDCFIHFNYLICEYRWFQKSEGSFEDEHFRLLLIRLLANACDPHESACKIPSLDELVNGITDGSNRVTYLQERTRTHYAGFRSKLQQLIKSGLLDEGKAASLQDGVRPFDKVFGREHV